MAGLRKEIDPDGLLEYSVVFTDRSLNHMSGAFQQVMRDISGTLKQVYNGQHVALVPGGGTYAMESVARQFATDRKTLVIRNGWFSFRWTQIFDAAKIPVSSTVMKARASGNDPQSAFAPAPIAEVVAQIKAEKPDVVFAAHVETASGMMLPDDYIQAMSAAQHEHGGLFVLDCIASGCVWVDMVENGVDVLISAPQKGWSASPSAGVVLMNDTAKQRCDAAESTSFALDLKKWSSIMEAYENGGHAYHATMPTDALRGFRDAMEEAREIGFEELKTRQIELGRRVREMLAARGFKSVAAPGFEAPGVVVSFTNDPDVKSGAKFAAKGMQIAAGVPLAIDEPADYSSFRLGLFGLDKLMNIDRTVATLETALDDL